MYFTDHEATLISATLVSVPAILAWRNTHKTKKAVSGNGGDSPMIDTVGRIESTVAVLTDSVRSVHQKVDSMDEAFAKYVADDARDREQMKHQLQVVATNGARRQH